jgi:hypothetical protein
VKSFAGWTKKFRPRTKNQVVGEALAFPGRWDPTSAASSECGPLGASDGMLEPPALLTDRVSRVVEVAGEFETAVELDSLVELLPEFGPATVDDLVGWLRSHPSTGRVSGRIVLARDVLDRPVDHGRQQRAERYCRAASSLLNSDLSAARPWLRFLGVTGSTAYGAPRAGDDCDLMAVVRPGSVWVFVAYTFLRLRVRRTRAEGAADPEWCFNYTLDENAAIEEFSRPRGFLFAREALVARPVEGESYYRGLIRRGEWLRREAPRLVARWEATPLPEPAEPEPAPRSVRFLNAFLFPVVAAYLQLKSLRVNRRFRRSGRSGECFRTITRLDRMTLSTWKFERLADRMGPASRLTPE